VFLSKSHKLHTTRSWEFLGLSTNDSNTAWQKGRFGENTIIANIDTGTKIYKFQNNLSKKNIFFCQNNILFRQNKRTFLLK